LLKRNISLPQTFSLCISDNILKNEHRHTYNILFSFSLLSTLFSLLQLIEKKVSKLTFEVYAVVYNQKNIFIIRLLLHKARRNYEFIKEVQQEKYMNYITSVELSVFFYSIVVKSRMHSSKSAFFF
jgi:hypothetical protein